MGYLDIKGQKVSIRLSLRCWLGMNVSGITLARMSGTPAMFVDKGRELRGIADTFEKSLSRVESISPTHATQIAQRG